MIQTVPEGVYEEIPPDAPTVPDHYLHGSATFCVRYGYAFAVAYYGEHREQLTWVQGRWQFKPYPAPRPLFGYEQLRKRPQAPVLIVDDERAALAARELLPPYVVVTWAGGPEGVLESEWRVLKKRDVLLWPNAGLFHVKLVEHLKLYVQRLRIVDTRGEPPGWNIAAASDASWNGAALARWATPRLTTPEQFKPPLVTPATIRSPLFDPAQWTEVRRRMWDDPAIALNARGNLYPTIANVSHLLALHPTRISYDDFTERVLHPVNGREQPWTDRDTLDLTVVMQERLRLPKLPFSIVGTGVLHHARQHRVHSLRSWLDGLVWDETPRLGDWLQDACGVEKTPYTQAVARNFLIALVARAYEPGCIFPYMLVLEGADQRGAELTLEALGSPHFAWLMAGFNETEFRNTVRGRWLVALPLAVPYSPHQQREYVARLTSRNDVYRDSSRLPPEDHLRTALFATTTRDALYDRGIGPQCWGVPCGKFDLPALFAQREQLFAEAVHAYRSGAIYHTVPQRNERGGDPLGTDPWTAAVLDFANANWEQNVKTGVNLYITSTRILTKAFEMPINKQSSKHKKRVNDILKANGWRPVNSPVGRYWRRLEP